MVLLAMLITNATLITWTDPNEVITDGALYIEDGVIRAVGTTRDLTERYPAAQRIDARGPTIRQVGADRRNAPPARA